MRRKIDLILSYMVSIAKIIIITIYNIGYVRISIPSSVRSNVLFRSYKKGKITIGMRTEIAENTSIVATEGDVIIGKGVYINRNCSIVAHDKIHIGDGVTIGQNTVIVDHDHNKNKRGSFVCSAVSIGAQVWIGSHVTILKGVSIGDNSVIGAGAVVTKDVPANCVYMSKHENIIKPIL